LRARKGWAEALNKIRPCAKLDADNMHDVAVSVADARVNT
jgi:hypothetical protein